MTFISQNKCIHGCVLSLIICVSVHKSVLNRTGLHSQHIEPSVFIVTNSCCPLPIPLAAAGILQFFVPCSVFRCYLHTANIITVFRSDSESDRIPITQPGLRSYVPCFIISSIPSFYTRNALCFSAVHYLVIYCALKVSTRYFQVTGHICESKDINSILSFLIISCRFAGNCQVCDCLSCLIQDFCLCRHVIIGNIYILGVDSKRIHHIFQLAPFIIPIRHELYYKCIIRNWILSVGWPRVTTIIIGFRSQIICRFAYPNL